MKERPILFSGEMVRAILDGRKTQTRRVVTPQPNGALFKEGDTWVERWFHSGADDREVTCPYGAPGDRLWVKETWAVDPCHDDLAPRDLPYSIEEDLRLNPEIAEIRYLADSAARLGKTRPSIFMPRWASRITLEIVSVRVERVQAISRGDATCEGCPFPNMADGSNPKWWFRDLWDSINAGGGFCWNANPWVWVIEFKRIQP